jgi:hypothetical protein
VGENTKNAISRRIRKKRQRPARSTAALPEAQAELSSAQILLVYRIVCRTTDPRELPSFRLLKEYQIGPFIVLDIPCDRVIVNELIGFGRS